MPRWWDSPFDVQKRTNTQEGLQKFGSMPKRKSPPVSAPTSGAEVGMGTDGNNAANASDKEVQEIAEQAFPRRPSRPQGSKAAKGELAVHSKREKIMQKQVLASERMAEASLLKATAMQDQCALSLFMMSTGEGLTEQAQRYIELRRTEEIERLERRIESERRAAELAKVEHERLLKECSYEAPRCRRGCAPAAPTSPAVTAAPPRTPEPAIANSAAGTFHFLNFLFSCFEAPVMAFGHLLDFFSTASQLLSWLSAPAVIFFCASELTSWPLAFGTYCIFFLCFGAHLVAFGLRHLLYFFLCFRAHLLAFGTCCIFFLCFGAHLMAFGTCCIFLLCFGAHVMAFGTCCIFFLCFGAHVMAFSHGHLLYFFLVLGSSSDGLRPPPPAVFLSCASKLI